jgi:diguanylate cyclase
VGDEVLRQVAKVLKAQSRDMDLPCRYGGEEFGVILPATDAASARKVAERIRAAVEESTTACDGKSLKVTCSVGVSEFCPGIDVDQLIRRADEALYASKKAGRNCGHWHNGVDCVPLNAPVEAPPVESAENPPADEPAVPPPPAASNGRATAPGTFVDLLKRRVTESHRFGIPLSVLHLKVEDHEVMNRKYGSAITRQVLDLAEPLLEKTLREMDSLARLENGEFVVMLPGQTQAEAGQVAKRMRTATSHCMLPPVDRELTFRFRHGVAELKPNETAQELLARARQAALAPAVSQKPAAV